MHSGMGSRKRIAFRPVTGSRLSYQPVLIGVFGVNSCAPANSPALSVDVARCFFLEPNNDNARKRSILDFFPRFSLSDADVAARFAAEAVSCPAFLACLVDLFCVESEPLVKQLKEDEMKDFMLVMFFP